MDIITIGPIERWAREHRECFISANRAGWWGDTLTFARKQDDIQRDLIAALEEAYDGVDAFAERNGLKARVTRSPALERAKAAAR